MLLLSIASLGWSETLATTLDAHCTTCPPRILAVSERAGPSFWSVWCSGVVCAVFGIHLRSCSCLLAVDVAERQVVGADGVWRCAYAVFAILVALADRPHPSTRGGARFEGWAARVCPGRRFGVRRSFSRFSTSVRVRIHVCWPSTWPRDRWWGLTAFGGASTPFSRSWWHLLTWVSWQGYSPGPILSLQPPSLISSHSASFSWA